MQVFRLGELRNHGSVGVSEYPPLERCSFPQVEIAYLESQDLGLDERQRLAVDLNEALALLFHTLAQVPNFSLVYSRNISREILRARAFTNLAMGDSGG